MTIFNRPWFYQSLRLLRHELRRGELTIICLAIVLAVATVFSLAGFSGQIKQGLLSKSTSFIAADRVLQSSTLIAPSMLDKSDELGLKRAKQVQMSSMVFAGDIMQLAEIKAVSQTYPLRGELLISTHRDGAQSLAKNSPLPGTVWVESKLLNMMQLDLGDRLEIGVKTFTITGIATQIPDASFSVFTSGPVVIVNMLDIAATELIQPASRITYKYLFAGPSVQVEVFEKWLKPQVNEAQRWYDIKSRQTPLANALNRAEKYLSLASMLGIILAAVAVAVASRRYSQRHQPTVAVFKAMGASLSHIKKLYCLHWALLSLFSIGLGLVAGYLLQQVGLYALREELSVQAATFSWYPLVVAFVTGLICAIAFALTPLKELMSTSALSVIRGFSDEQPSTTFAKYCVQFLPAIFALFSLLWLFSRDLVLSGALLLGGLVVSAILLSLGRLLMGAGRVAGSRAGKSWHLAMANLKRRARENSVQLVSFTVAIQLLLMILVIKSALISEWQQQLPDNAANRFLININQQQAGEVASFIAQNDIAASDILPVVRGRLSAINDEKLARKASKDEDKAADNGRRGIGRELSLTWRKVLSKEDVISSGQGWHEQDEQAQVSIEQGIAERLDIVLGDELTFQIGSESFTVPVTSIREVNWQSMQPNFYMIFNAAVLQDFPSVYIASLHVPESKKMALQTFLGNYPTISMIDIDAMIGQLRSVIDQVSVAVEFILILVVLAGSLVLVAQVQASMEERERELAILRTLGAKGKLLRNSVLYEFVALGAVAGLMASVAMELAVYVLQSQVFEMEARFHFEYWLLGIFAGGCFVGLVGLLSCWRLLKLSSITLIRRTM